MIDLVNSKAIIRTRDELTIDFGVVTKQDSNSIVVRFMNFATAIPVHRKYAFPDDFENGLIYIDGEANTVLLRSIKLMNQYNAIKISMDSLGLSGCDSTYKSLEGKQKEIENELSMIQKDFESALKAEEEKRYWNHINTAEENLKRYMSYLVEAIEAAKRYKEEYDNYSGFKFKKEYKQLKAMLEDKLDSIGIWTESLNREEKELKKYYDLLGRDYDFKYSELSLQYPLNVNNCNSFFTSFPCSRKTVRSSGVIF